MTPWERWKPSLTNCLWHCFGPMTLERLAAPKSKRLSGHKKYKIERKVKEHRKKEKKNAAAKEKRPRGFQSQRERAFGVTRRRTVVDGTIFGLNVLGSKKDPGIPNTFPFKGELVEQIQEKKAKVGLDSSDLGSGHRLDLVSLNPPKSFGLMTETARGGIQSC